MALFFYQTRYDFNEKPRLDIYEPSQREYREDFFERSAVTHWEKGPRAYPDCQHQHEHTPLYAADKVWTFNKQAYTGPIAGPHAEAALSAIYGMDFPQLFEQTRILYVLFGKLPNIPAENDAQADETIVAFLQQKSFFTRFFNETLSRKNLEKFEFFIQDLYQNAKKYHEKTNEDDRFQSQNPFHTFANVEQLYVVQTSYDMRFDYHHSFKEMAQEMDSIVEERKNKLMAKNPTIPTRMLLKKSIQKMNSYFSTKKPHGNWLKRIASMANHMDQPRQVEIECLPELHLCV